jgi:hypothetical protein
MIRRRVLLGGLVASAVLAVPAVAHADIGITSVSPNSATPGQSVEVDIGCGWPKGCPPGIPVSLIAASQAPEPHPCVVPLSRADRRHGRVHHALCGPISIGPPRRRPYTLLGQAATAKQFTYGQSYALRFRVPRLRPGRYAFVAYAAYRHPRGKGALVSSTPSKPFLIHRERRAVAADPNGSLTTWPLAASAIAILVAGIALRRRLRPRASPSPARR